MLSSGEERMQTIDSTKRAVVAAIAASLAMAAAPATADDSGLRAGHGVAPGTLASGNNLTGTGPGVGADGNAGLNLNSAADGQTSATNFQSSRLTVPDALNRLSVHSDSAGKPSLIYKFVNTKF